MGWKEDARAVRGRGGGVLAKGSQGGGDNA